MNSASYTTNGNTATLQVRMSFTSTFAQSYSGTKVLWAAVSGTQNTGWQAAGTFTVTGGPTGSGPAVSGMTPTPSGGGTGTFNFTIVDPIGWQDINIVDVLINRGLNGNSACYVALETLRVDLMPNDPTQPPYAGQLQLPGLGSNGFRNHQQQPQHAM